MKKVENEVRIQRMSRKLRYLFQVCLYLLPALPVIYWLAYNHLPPVIQGNVFGNEVPVWLAVNSRLIGFFGGVPAIFVLVLALRSLKRLFSLYEEGVWFQAENVRQFRLLGKLAFWSVVADVFNKSMLTVAQSINNPPGERMLSIGLGSDHLKLMVVAVIIMLIGMVMDEGRKIYDENQLTV